MRNLSPKEQYECIRLLLATRTNDVFVCTHKATNSYIDLILKNLPIGVYQCSNNSECLEQREGLSPK
jgi:hypothetical protein